MDIWMDRTRPLLLLGFASAQLAMLAVLLSAPDAHA
jgi:hypothetical protein